MSRVTIIKIMLYCLLIIANGCTLASSSENLSESEHPYSNNFEQEWTVTNTSGATEIRLHFENLDLAASDNLILYDKYDNVLVTYTRWDSSKDFWTEWYTGDLLKIKLVTDNADTAYGFKIDKVENRMDVCPSNSSLAESYHPYANNFEHRWPDISKSGASQIRLHFENLDLGSSDRLIVYDKYDNELVTYNRWDSSKDFWTEWYAGDTLKVKFVTDNSYTGYGFKIDDIGSRSDMWISDNSVAESYHPYANNFECMWPDISKPGASQIRLHFENLDLGSSDRLIVYDKYDNELVTYNRWDSSKDFWTEWYAGDTLKVKFVTDNSYTGYGFKIDKGELRDDKNVTTVFESAGTSDFNSELSEKTSDYPQNITTVYRDYIHNQFVDLAITLNLLDEEDNQSWIYKNVEWIFGGFGVPLITAIGTLLKRSKDKKPEDKKPEDKKPEDKKPEDKKSEDN